MSANRMPVLPWYRHRWPWMLMLGPAIVVIAGVITAWIAVRSDDGLVIDDYYKQGLAINQTLGRSSAAGRQGIEATLQFADSSMRVLLAAPAEPGALTLRLVHPTRSGQDQNVSLVAVEPGVYAGRLRPVQPGRWYLMLEALDWRLTGEWLLPAVDTLTLRAPGPPPGMTEAKEGRQ